MNENTTFILFPNCIVQKGFSNSLIADLQFSKTLAIPNELANFFLFEENRKPLSKLKQELPSEDFEGLISFFNYLQDKGVGFFTEIPDSFPSFNMEWDYPGKISNCIIEVNSKSHFTILPLIEKLENLGCQAIQLWIEQNITLAQLKSFAEALNSKGITNLEVVVPYALYEQEHENFMSWLKGEPIFRTIKIINSPNHHIEEVFSGGNAYYGVLEFISSQLQENWKELRMDCNIQTFTESFNFNAYLNRKLFIGAEGEIKNAPECKKSFGVYSNEMSFDSLNKIIDSEEFQKLWKITPDQIDIEKDSQYRNLFITPKIPIQRENGSWYYEEEPDFNPYINKWKDEAGYLTLAECGVTCDNEEFKIDSLILERKIAEISELQHEII